MKSREFVFQSQNGSEKTFLGEGAFFKIVLKRRKSLQWVISNSDSQPFYQLCVPKGRNIMWLIIISTHIRKDLLFCRHFCMFYTSGIFFPPLKTDLSHMYTHTQLQNNNNNENIYKKNVVYSFHHDSTNIRKAYALLAEICERWLIPYPFLCHCSLELLKGWPFKIFLLGKHWSFQNELSLDVIWLTKIYPLIY